MNLLVYRVFCIVLVVVINSEIRVGATAAYGEACATGTTDCTETATETCIDLTCQCKTTHFRNHENTACEARIAIDTACDTADSDPCTAGANLECKDDGAGTTKCLCITTHYDASGTCTARILPEVACNANQCVEHATCDTTCKCDTGYTASPTASPTMCSANGVVKFASLSYMYLVPILLSMMSLLR